MKARAQVLVGPGEFELRTLDVPPPGPGELRLRVHGCGICGSDKVLAYTAEPGTVLGHEVIAEVESCGEEVSGWQRGDRAVPVGDHVGMGGARLGGFCEALVVQADACLPVPEQLSSRVAVLAEPMANGLHFVRRARLEAGQDVAIFGAGQIGLFILYWARHLGAGRIAVVEPVPERARFAHLLGADAVIDPTATDVSAAVVEAIGRPRLVFEATGRAEVVRDAIHLVGAGGGTVVIAGITLEEVAIRPVSLILKETDLIFPLGTIREEVEETIVTLASGVFPAERFVTHRIRQADIPPALQALGAPSDQIKVVIDYA
jgi:(R,R)-butanediol dehydrogenase/meso-butanediol dehydrogenase/diacetyl reductase